MTFYVIYNSIGEPVEIFYPNAYSEDLSFDIYYDYYYRDDVSRWG